MVKKFSVRVLDYANYFSFLELRFSRNFTTILPGSDSNCIDLSFSIISFTLALSSCSNFYTTSEAIKLDWKSDFDPCIVW